MSEQHYIYKIVRDEDPESPRDWDNLGTMCCWHRRYNLGDVQPKCDPDEYLRNLACAADPKLADTLEWLEERGMEERYRKAVERSLERNYLFLECFLYDHSGLSMSTGGFSCPWDSGQVGIIYVSKAKVREEYGIKKVTKAWADKIRGYLDQEVQVYDQYLTGDVWGFQVFEVPEGVDPEEEIEALEEVESCFGFFGEDAAEEEAKANLAYYEEHHAERLFERQQAEFREAGQLELPLAA